MYKRGASRFTQYTLRQSRVQSIASDSTLWLRSSCLHSAARPICRYSTFPWSIAEDNAQKNIGDKGKDGRQVSQLILRGFVKSGQTDKAIEMLVGMKEANIIDWTMVIGQVAKTPGQIDHAFSLLREMKKVGLRPNLYTYGVLINGCLRAGRKEKALELFAEMKGAGISPDMAIYTTIIAGLARLKEFTLAEEFCEELDKLGQLSSQAATPLIDAYAKMGDMNKALSVFGKAKPTVFSYSCLISGYVRQGNIPKALEYFEAMKQDKIKPDVILYTAVIVAYLKRQQVDKAFEIFEQLKAELFPDVTVYYTLIDGCMKCNQPQRVPPLLKEMQDAGFDVAKTDLLAQHPTVAQMLRTENK